MCCKFTTRVFGRHLPNAGLVAVFLFAATIINAQTYHRCSTMEHLEYLKKEDPQLEYRMKEIEDFTQDYIANSAEGSRGGGVTIPVVFHVVYNTPAQNIPDALILAQIHQLNADFARTNTDASNTPPAFAPLGANTNIQFCLAKRDPSGNPTNGIVRRSTSVTSFSTNNAVKFNSSGGSNAWPSGSYLNIWVCNLGGGLLGYAQFPGGPAATDGIVVLYSSVGSISTPGTATPYHLGRTATHEVGHWLNLYHIWGDDGTACTGTDNVGDTPNQAGPNSGCPGYPKVSCSNGPNGDMFMNYMDYTTDACMNIFTIGQSSRMNALFASGGPRNSLLTSLGCQTTSPPACLTPVGLVTLSIGTNIAYANWQSVNVAVSYNLQYKLLSSPTWTTLLNTKDTILPMADLFVGSTYQWRVQTVCANDTSLYSAPVTFSTLGSCVDNYEPNNTSSSAIPVLLNAEMSAQISAPSDVDWYSITTASPNTKLRIDLTNLPANYDMVLFNATKTSKIVSSENGGPRSETIKHNSTTADTYYLKIYGSYGASSATKCYNLLVSTSSNNFRTIDDEENDDLLHTNTDILLYPNPAHSQISVTFDAGEVSEGLMLIYSTNGQLTITRPLRLNEGENKIVEDISHLPTGLYHLLIRTDTALRRISFIISR